MEPGSATRVSPSSRKILKRVLRFGVVLPDSILATEEWGRPQSCARSRWEISREWRRSIIVPTILETASASSMSFPISGLVCLT